MGLERILTASIVDLMQGQGREDMPTGLHLDGGTPNHKALAAACSYGWTRSFGTPADRQKARERVENLFAQQKTGHYAWGGTNEVLTASHYNWWGTALAALRWFARRENDTAIVDLTGKWWRSEIALLSLMSVPSGELEGKIVSPGARTRYDPAVPASGGDTARDVMYSLIMRLNANKKKKAWFDAAASKESLDTVAAWIVRELLDDGDDLGGARQAGLQALSGSRDELPPLLDRLQVVRTSKGHVAWFTKVTSRHVRQKPQFWAWCDYESGKQEYGLEAVDTPKEPPGGFASGRKITVEAA